MLNVAWCMKKMRAAPPHSSAVRPPATVAGERDAEPERRRESGDHPQHERVVDEPDPRVREQVLGVAALVGDLHVAEHPPEMGVDEPVDRAAPARAVPDVRAVRVAVDVGELVVLAMGRDPVDHRPFGGRRSERGERRPREPVALEAAVGQQPVEADGYPGPDRHVEQSQDQEVLPVQEVAGPAEPHADTPP